MKRLFILFAAFSVTAAAAQPADSLVVDYFDHSPLSFSEDGVQKGIEIDIINEYILWLSEKKNMTVEFRFSGFKDFDSFFQTVRKSGPNVIGLGSVTMNSERQREVDFTTPYLRNVSFCVTSGNAPDVKARTADEVVRTLGSMTALTVSNTAASRYVSELKKAYVQDLKVSYVESEIKVMEEVAANVLRFGYVNAIGFWFYVKSHPGKFLKVQKPLSQSKEEMAFALPKGSPHKALFNEFFASFKSTPAYRGILEKYLGSYMAQQVAIN